LLLWDRVGKSKGIRHRLLTILVLGVIVSGLSLAALIHLLTTSTRQRVDRARDAISEEVTRIAQDPRRLEETAPFSVVGMRGGVVRSHADAPPLSEPLRTQVALAIRGAPGPLAVESVPFGDSTLVVATKRAAQGGIAWAAFPVRPLPSLQTWQWIVTLLALATGVLVATTVYAIVTVHRGATDLRRALSDLATDLAAPIPRPGVRELASVAEGVQRLADGLAEARREEQRLQLELSRRERLAALGRVAAGVAHEVRNPLASIKLRLDLAASGTTLPEGVAQAITHATTEIGRLDRLVADLLIVAGRAPGTRTAADLGALVRARVELLSPWAAERGVHVVAAGAATIEMDVDAVSRAIDNLLRNALEASAPGQHVLVEVALCDGRVLVTVEDHGPGVAPPHVSELFEPFFTTKPDGTGLGLALSRAIARAHGGDLSYSRTGSATRFELSLGPPSEAKPQSVPTSAPDASPDSGSTVPESAGDTSEKRPDRVQA
jgi:signal transduction histidine kinase